MGRARPVARVTIVSSGTCCSRSPRAAPARAPCRERPPNDPAAMPVPGSHDPERSGDADDCSHRDQPPRCRMRRRTSSAASRTTASAIASESGSSRRSSTPRGRARRSRSTSPRRSRSASSPRAKRILQAPSLVPTSVAISANESPAQRLHHDYRPLRVRKALERVSQRRRAPSSSSSAAASLVRSISSGGVLLRGRRARSARRRWRRCTATRAPGEAPGLKPPRR